MNRRTEAGPSIRQDADRYPFRKVALQGAQGNAVQLPAWGRGSQQRQAGIGRTSGRLHGISRTGWLSWGITYVSNRRPRPGVLRRVAPSGVPSEMRGGVRNYGRASLASSIWLVCRKRRNLRPGWDSSVLGEMRENISGKLRDFWDAGIRGPDFVGGHRTGAGNVQQVPGRQESKRPEPAHDRLGVPARGAADGGRFCRRTRPDSRRRQGSRNRSRRHHAYYLLHRHDFGMGEAPVGGCILYALSCNLSDSALVHQHDLLSQPGRRGRTSPRRTIRRRTAPRRRAAAPRSSSSPGAAGGAATSVWKARAGGRHPSSTRCTG